MTASMSSFRLCDVCRSTCTGACPHFTDLNRAVPIFPEPRGVELHEFPFFGHHDAVPAWAFDDPRYGDPSRAPDESPPPPVGFQFLDGLSHEGRGNHGRGVTLEVCLNEEAPDQTPNAAPAPVDCSAMAASSATIMSFSGSTLTDASSGKSNMDGLSFNPTGQGHDLMTERESKVRRYKEKRNKRRYEKQIRYASRKAYAEMRPRIKGRFAKVQEAPQETSQAAASVPAPPYDEDRSMSLRWFHS